MAVASDPDDLRGADGRMPPPESASAIPAWWTPERAALYDWLQHKAPGLAPLYQSAVLMVVDERFPGRVPFVAHAIREIRNRLPDAVAGEVTATRPNYVDLTAAVYVRWMEDGHSPDGVQPVDAGSEPPAAGLTRREISAGLYGAVADLIAGHVAASENNEARARRLFEAVGGSAPPTYVVKSWLRGTRWAHGFAHVRNQPLSREDEQSLTANFVAFEQALIAIANRSYENMDSLDEILESANR